ncbi:MAG: prepilin peptidase [Burkholderiaceae bacterium]|jgi:leader peptidase (prepilin peptidase)/N-methyltransferase|nr:prepilin peptidase [Burkholderiaceae bacterium]
MSLTFSILIACLLLVLSLIDWRTFLLPDWGTFSLMGVGFLLNFFHIYPYGWQESVLGLLCGYGLIWLANFIYRYIKGQDGMGMGDAKLLAGLGACYGISLLPIILLGACLIGLAGGILWLQIKGQSLRSAFPFGPYLALSGVLIGNYSLYF